MSLALKAKQIVFLVLEKTLYPTDHPNDDRCEQSRKDVRRNKAKTRGRLKAKDKGKSGKVLKAMPKENKVVVEGVNVQTKHAKATQKTPAEIKHIEGPIDASNVMYYDTKAKQASRLGYKVKEDGTKVRVSKKTGNVID